jgi:hypothetical protein
LQQLKSENVIAIVRPLSKFIVSLFVYALLTLSYKIAMANETISRTEAVRVENYISTLYKQLDFQNFTRLSYTVFDKAMRGYINLRNAGKLNTAKEILTICDFNQPSVLDRLWVIDLATKRVLYNTYVAHGQSTGEGCAVDFSNKVNSHKSSLGFYVTAQTYTGDNGLSLRMEGMDQGFNDAAYKRDIVVHGAPYVSDQYINENQRLGRSWGCPAVPVDLAAPIIETIKEGTCLFIYYPEPKYLASAYWLNKKVSALPDYNVMANMIPSDINRPPVRTFQYIHNGKLDSVRKVPLL